MASVYNTIDNFFGIDSIVRGFSSAERVAKSIEASAVNAARAYAGIASSSVRFADILQSAAAVGAVLGSGNVIGGKFFSADREMVKRDSGSKNFSFDLGIGGGIAVALQYSAALGAARTAAFGTIGTLGALGVAVNTVRENTNGAYDITLSFGGILGGTVGVALAALGNSVIWLRKLCADSITEVGNSAMVLAAFFGGMWDDPVSMAVTRFMWFGNSALSIIGSVISGIGSISAGAPSGSMGNFSQKNVVGGLGDILFGDNSSFLGKSVFKNISSAGNSFFSSDYIRYDKAFTAGYLIGDILMRSAGVASRSGNSYTKISSVNSEKITSEVLKISENTGKAAAASEISVDDLKFLRDIAARDVINHFTTAQVSVSMGGVTNNLSGTADLDGIVDYLANGVKTAMESAAEGVHS